MRADLRVVERVAYLALRAEEAAIFHSRTRDRGRYEAALQIHAEVCALVHLSADLPAPLRLLLGPALRRQSAALVGRLGSLVPAEELRRRLAAATCRL